eukprot:CAMPEP_0173403376 /NCGR_PEP_ID=MMETSP1356-20130122/56600_1 /TAXON_ID=77927 ORGANISM="Hemiselmis virescens, Strain PCC157" /NCGR_SAMPLE_ID=MMETSP1356 /ASSEMBLY_ACC=CAM_ASM_000847 /LENGTH=113 /DNA_ID=CAMNT_0014363889 /DNA_START=21 /DNA_END=359 /DNA_ORIENTATION=+
MMLTTNVIQQRALIFQQTQQQIHMNEGELGLLNHALARQSRHQSQLEGVPVHLRSEKLRKMEEKTAEARNFLSRDKAAKETGAHEQSPAWVDFSTKQSRAYKNVWKSTGVSPE